MTSKLNVMNINKQEEKGGDTWRWELGLQVFHLSPAHFTALFSFENHLPEKRQSAPALFSTVQLNALVVNSSGGVRERIKISFLKFQPPCYDYMTMS